MIFLIFLKSYPAEINLHNVLPRITQVYTTEVRGDAYYSHSPMMEDTHPWVTIGGEVLYTSQSSFQNKKKRNRK